jgi:hypothetical protein
MPIRDISSSFISFPTEFAYLFCGGVAPEKTEGKRLRR